MADEAEAAEAQRLINEINRVEAQIRRELERMQMLEVELDFVMGAVVALTPQAARLSEAVDTDLGALGDRIKTEELGAGGLLNALADLSQRYFTYKNLSTATKNLTRFSDEYHARFSYYHDLRRITLGYVVGLDAQLVSSEIARKRVEKAYLQNSEYWLTYCIMATMLWASAESEAAARAVSKSLSLDAAKASLFFLLVNLRFARIDAATRWYSYYLDRADSSHLSEVWQYLLQAYLSGAMGASQQLEARVRDRLSTMMAEVHVTNISYDRDVAARAYAHALAQPHVTEFPFALLRECSAEWELLRETLSLAERNAILAEEFSRIAAEDLAPGDDLASRIEETLYNLIAAMDADEERVYKRIKYNEFIVAAKGDLSLAQEAYDERYPASDRSSFGDLLMRWAFSSGDVRVSPRIRRFSMGFLKDWIAVGMRRHVDEYRKLEQERYEIHVGNWSFVCSEAEADLAVSKFEDHFGKNRWKDFLKDTYVLLSGGAVALALLIIVWMIAARTFSSAAVVIAVLLGICGGFVLWRRIVDLEAVLEHQKHVSMERIRKVLAELAEWRTAYKAADAAQADIEQALELFD